MFFVLIFQRGWKSRVTVSMSRFTSGSITLKEGLKTSVKAAQISAYLTGIRPDISPNGWIDL